MSDIIPFEFESNEIRTVVDKNGTIAFVAKDIAKILGYKNISDAIKDNCKGVARSYPLKTEGGTQKVRIITEPDVYRLIVKSKLPSAEKFERKVFEEILPTLRKTGSYSIKKPPKAVSPTSYIKAHQFIKQTLSQTGLKENQLMLATNRGVAELTGFDLLASAEISHLPSSDNDEYLTPTLIGEKLNPVMNAKNLNKLLLKLGLQLSKATGGYLPTAKGLELGGKLFDVSKHHTDGSTQQLKWNANLLIPFVQTHLNNHSQNKENKNAIN
ncbi:MAG: phage repressor protein [Candidatus Liberibacter europaeus]|uniref:Phage repressor protein n=1 Tax=Candidatus Liberibacter europaeus TaxID=744859 RepID=A0A2T4VXD9_9HYPH|nr:MAG: phage repressor protein [Candidatus Liberibacter europaeus]